MDPLVIIGLTLTVLGVLTALGMVTVVMEERRTRSYGPPKLLRSGSKATGTIAFTSAAPTGISHLPLDVDMTYQSGQLTAIYEFHAELFSETRGREVVLWSEKGEHGRYPVDLAPKLVMNLVQAMMDRMVLRQKQHLRGEFYLSCGSNAMVRGRMMRMRHLNVLSPKQRANLRADVAIEGQLSATGAEVSVGSPSGMPWNRLFQSRTGFEIRGDRLVPRDKNPHISPRSRLDLGAIAVTGVLESSRNLGRMTVAVEYGSVPVELVCLVVFLMAEDYFVFEDFRTMD